MAQTYTVLSPEALLLMGVFLALCGVVLAFLGKKALGQFMSLMGAVVGGTAGYIVGGSVSPSSPYLAIALGFIGTILGSITLSYASHATLAFFLAFVSAIVAYLALGGTPRRDVRGQDFRVMIALLVMVVVFAIVYYFIEELMSFVTALLGGVLVGAGAYLITQDAKLAAIVLGIVFLAGFAVQYALNRRREGRARGIPG